MLGPEGDQRIRPTADRVRETVFNILGQWLDHLLVLDLYAGTGALACEALSRGAAKAVLVDRDSEALSLCRSNCQALNFGDRVTIISSDVERAIKNLGIQELSFDLIFADPPYAVKAVSQILKWIADAKLLRLGGRCVIEHGKKEDSPADFGGSDVSHLLHKSDQRNFGDTGVTIYQRLQ